MKYIRKTEIIEAVKWDGKIETIQNNKWLEEAIKEDRLTLGMNDLHDKEPILLLFNEFSSSFDIIKKGNYIIKDGFNPISCKIRFMKAERFKEEFIDIDEFMEETKKTPNQLGKKAGLPEINSNTKMAKESKEPLILRCRCKISNIGAKEEELSKKLGRKVVILENGLELL